MKHKIIVLILFLALILGLSLWFLAPYTIDINSKRTIILSSNNSELKFGKRQKLQSKKIDSILINAMQLNDFIGVTTGFYSTKYGKWSSTSGFKEIKGKRAPNADTKFRLASVSKPMTAVAIMQLYEKGIVDLDTPIRTYLNAFQRYDKGDITIRQLLNHTSGIPHYKSNWEVLSFTQYDSMADAMNTFKDRALSFKPGTSFEYSTFGYTVLGAIIEQVTGKTFQAYMRENIWYPLNMVNTDIEEYEIDYENKANLYIKLGNTYLSCPKTNLSMKYPGGGIYSTAEDLLKFGKAIINNELIDSSSFALMTSSPDTVKQGTYGFGWNIRNDDHYGKIIEHGGSQVGTSSIFQVYLDKEFVVSVIANNTNSDHEVYFLSRDLSDFVLDSIRWDLPINFYVPQENKVIKQYIGEYINNDEKISITSQNNQLYLLLNPNPKFLFYPSSEDHYFCRFFDGKLKFIKNGDKTEAVQYTYKGNPKLYQKLQ